MTSLRFSPMHVGEALVPALDHLACSQLELEGLVAVMTGVKLGAIIKGSRVVHGQYVALLRLHFAFLGQEDDLHVELVGSDHGQHDGQRQQDEMLHSLRNKP